MDLVPGVTLKKFVRKFENGLGLSLSKNLVAQLLKIVAYLHSKDVQICHRDINPNNLMVSEEENPVLTLIDFNVSRSFKDPHSDLKALMLTITGAAAFAAPEIRSQEGFYSEKVDLWSVGACLYFMLVGQVPFPQEDIDSLDKAITSGSFDKSHPRWGSLPEDAQLFIGKLLSVNPDKRYNVEQAMKDPWIIHELQT